MKRLIFITLLLLALSPAFAFSAQNPYPIYGQGNCTYMVWECVYAYHGVSIEPVLDAGDWGQLVGQWDGYRIERTDTPSIGDIAVWPREYPYSQYGHVAFICGMRVKSLATHRTVYRIIESSVYAGGEYPMRWGDYRYREVEIELSDDVTFLHIERVGD